MLDFLIVKLTMDKKSYWEGIIFDSLNYLKINTNSGFI